jgi:4-amino-4-deoxy-L-arabinose transferase-like glycosyltransferase
MRSGLSRRLIVFLTDLPDSSRMFSNRFRRHASYLIAFCLVLAVGIFLRLPTSLFEGKDSFLSRFHPNTGSAAAGFDESLYRGYVNGVIRGGLANYPTIVEHYIEVQKTLVGSILPPMRFLYIFAAYVWHQVFGTEALQALRNVASFFSILSLLLAVGFAWRLKGSECALGVGAFVAVAPTQIHMSQHAFVDGFFAFWALLTLWAFWESLQAPRNWRWLVAYTLGQSLMVMTKENAAFVYIALLVLLFANRWLRWAEITRELLAGTLIGPFFGILLLVALAGGPRALLDAYELSVSKNYHLVYAITTGDGPWHRYFVDLLLVSPVILILAFGRVFQLDRTQKPELFLTIFIAASYLVMCNVKYGMNLRYANMWDTPLRILAFGQLTALAQSFRQHRTALLAAAVVFICAVELRQYLILFVDYGLHELVSEGLLRALQILKSVPASVP